MIKFYQNFSTLSLTTVAPFVSFTCPFLIILLSDVLEV